MIPTRILRSLAPAAAGILAALGFLAASGPALAFSSGSSLIQEICSGAGCQQLRVPETSGMDFQFVFGARPLRDGIALDVRTDGSLFVVGPIRSTGDIRIATNALHVGDIDDPDGSTGGSGGNIRIGTIDIQLEEVTLLPPVICACVSIGDGRLRIRGDEIVLASVAQHESGAHSNPLAWTASFEGDVYLDLSGFEFASIHLSAEQKIIFVDKDLLPIPEPGTAMLFGLGLAALGRRRTQPA